MDREGFEPASSSQRQITMQPKTGRLLSIILNQCQQHDNIAWSLTYVDWR